MRNLLDEAVLTHGDLHSDFRSGVGYVKVDEIPFDFERRRMSVVVETADDAKHYLICKGAVEEITAVCDRADRNGVSVPIAKGHETIAGVTRELHEDGFRVIAVAFKELPPGPATYCRRRMRPHAAGLHRVSRSAEGDGRGRIGVASRRWRRGEGADGGQ